MHVGLFATHGVFNISEKQRNARASGWALVAVAAQITDARRFVCKKGDLQHQRKTKNITYFWGGLWRLEALFLLILFLFLFYFYFIFIFALFLFSF